LKFQAVAQKTAKGATLFCRTRYICNTHSIRRYRHFPLLYIVKWKNV